MNQSAWDRFPWWRSTCDSKIPLVFADCWIMSQSYWSWKPGEKCFPTVTKHPGSCEQAVSGWLHIPVPFRHLPVFWGWTEGREGHGGGQTGTRTGAGLAAAVSIKSKPSSWSQFASMAPYEHAPLISLAQSQTDPGACHGFTLTMFQFPKDASEGQSSLGAMLVLFHCCMGLDSHLDCFVLHSIFCS